MNMKRNVFTLVAATTSVLALTLLCGPTLSHAAGVGFDVNFAPNPLFSQLQFAPGATATSLISVTNNYSPTDSEQVYVQAENTNSSVLASMLILTIQSGSTVLYSDTLAHFFSASRVPLTSVVPGATAAYDASVTFDPGASNTYQGKSVGFDLCVGIGDGDVQCDNTVTVPTVPGNTTLASFSTGGSISPTLTVFNESGASRSDTTGVVTWSTNLPATSYVVYGARSGGPYTLSTAGPLFGYPNQSTEDASLTTAHRVVISGLVPGTVYDFRVVSKLSPSGVPTVGSEYQLALPGELTAATEQSLGAPAPGAGSLQVAGTHSSGTGTAGFSTSPSGGETGTSSTSQTTVDAPHVTGNQLAAAAALAGPFTWLKNPCVWFFILFCVLAALAELLYEYLRRGVAYEAPRAREVRRSIFYVAASVVGVGASLVFGRMCDVLPFIVLAVVFAALGFYLRRRF